MVSGRISGERWKQVGVLQVFRRAVTDVKVNWSSLSHRARPVTFKLGNERAKLRHVAVLVFARGLLRHLI